MSKTSDRKRRTRFAIFQLIDRFQRDGVKATAKNIHAELAKARVAAVNNKNGVVCRQYVSRKMNEISKEGEQAPIAKIMESVKNCDDISLFSKNQILRILKLYCK